MKILSSVIAATALLAVAGAASAADPITIGGSAEKVCTLPDSWAFVSSGGGQLNGTFSGTTWTIPESALADASSVAVTGSEYAIRVRGFGTCNASHTIRLQSTRGGLVTGAPASAAPNGFANRRSMHYEAYWSDNGAGANTVAFGPKAAIATVNTPGQQAVANYNVSGALAPPGNRAFDIRLGMLRGALATPLIAGAYSDTVVITIALAP
ncbi:MAG: hypothetical protein Q7T61_15980 [Caulobacter sp.]|nr:hypothetical protein [Caulobacter sp.]